MNTYVIRIVRQSRKDPEQFAGIVELVETDGWKTFRSKEQLFKILCGKDKRRPSRGNGKVKR